MIAATAGKITRLRGREENQWPLSTLKDSGVVGRGLSRRAHHGQPETEEACPEERRQGTHLPSSTPHTPAPHTHEIQALEVRGPPFVHTKALPWLRFSIDI